MVDLSVKYAGIASPNPFWLASGPTTHSAEQVMRAFSAGWGGAVWKTLGQPVLGVSRSHHGVQVGTQRIPGLHTLESISSRPLADNLRDITDVKQRYPGHALIVSIIADTREKWQELARAVEATGCDGLELNLGSPHAMDERGMGSAMGKEPVLVQQAVGAVKEVSTKPVFVKLTPHVADIRLVARAAVQAGADGLSLVDGVKSLLGVDLGNLVALPMIGGKGAYGGLSGPALKPLALYLLSQVAGDGEVQKPVSGMGGISTWQDAAEFMALGATTVQVCTAAMRQGFGIIHELVEGLTDFLTVKGIPLASELVGRALAGQSTWTELSRAHGAVARIDPLRCIGCGLCHVSCRDGAQHCIHFHGATDAALETLKETLAQRANPPPATRVPYVDESRCVGCNLCTLVCPVEGCITVEDISSDANLTLPPLDASVGPAAEARNTERPGDSTVHEEPVDGDESEVPSVDESQEPADKPVKPEDEAPEETPERPTVVDNDFDEGEDGEEGEEDESGEDEEDLEEDEEDLEGEEDGSEEDEGDLEGEEDESEEDEEDLEGEEDESEEDEEDLEGEEDDSEEDEEDLEGEEDESGEDEEDLEGEEDESGEAEDEEGVDEPDDKDEDEFVN